MCVKQIINMGDRDKGETLFQSTLMDPKFVRKSVSEVLIPGTACVPGSTSERFWLFASEPSKWTQGTQGHLHATEAVEALCSQHGSWDATYQIARTVTSTPRSRPQSLRRALPDPRSAGQAHLRTCAGEFGYLADHTHLIGYEPKELDKTTSVDGDTTPINDPGPR